MHGNDSVILCERYEARDLTPNLSCFHSAATVALYRVLPTERLEKANFVPAHFLSLRMWIATFRLHTVSLLQAMRSIEYASLIYSGAQL